MRLFSIDFSPEFMEGIPFDIYLSFDFQLRLTAAKIKKEQLLADLNLRKCKSSPLLG